MSARCTYNPISDISPKKVIEGEMLFFSTAAECVRYLDAAREEGSDFYLWSMFALNTGARETEFPSDAPVMQTETPSKGAQL